MPVTPLSTICSRPMCEPAGREMDAASAEGPSSLPYARVAAIGGIAILLVLALADAVLAQGAFGLGPHATTPAEATGGIAGWLLQKQASYYREFTGMIRAAKRDGSAAYGLLGLSFAYGIFHAAGPGHGKAVITSYLFANGESWRRGVILSFASALLQSSVAIAIVVIAAVLLGSTARVMGNAVRVVEIASYMMVAAIGLRMAWVKTRAFLAAWQAWRPNTAVAAFALAGADGHVHTIGNFDSHAQHSNHDHHHADGSAHEHACAGHGLPGGRESCGHSHGLEPDDLVGPGGWRRGLTAILAAGLRPCSGAIIILVFSLAQGLLWTGMAATFAMGIGTAITVAGLATFAVGARSLAGGLAGSRQVGGLLALRGVELMAALAIVLVGLLLLTGYMASERMFLV
jgi:nickel/cobalt exporter